MKAFNLSRKIFILSSIILAISFVLFCYILLNQPLGKLFIDKSKGLEFSGFIALTSFVVVLITTCMGGSEGEKI